jgi:hypothetical protein
MDTVDSAAAECATHASAARAAKWAVKWAARDAGRFAFAAAAAAARVQRLPRPSSGPGLEPSQLPLENATAAAVAATTTTTAAAAMPVSKAVALAVGLFSAGAMDAASAVAEAKATAARCAADAAADFVEAQRICGIAEAAAAEAITVFVELSYATMITFHGDREIACLRNVLCIYSRTCHLFRLDFLNYRVRMVDIKISRNLSNLFRFNEVTLDLFWEISMHRMTLTNKCCFVSPLLMMFAVVRCVRVCVRACVGSVADAWVGFR